jgi:hypothetical protein
MPIFTDSESAFAIVPEGDYILTVFDFLTDISSGKITNGVDRFNIVFLIEGSDSRLKESLLDHPSCLWKIDTFLKSCGIRNLQKGQAFHFEKARAEEMGVPWINPMGLKCWAAVMQDKYTSNRGNEVTKNKVATYHTDKEVLKPDPELRMKPTSTGKPPF